MEGALFENRVALATDAASHYFTDCVATLICEHPADIVDICQQIENALDAGYFVACAFSYELGYYLEPCLTPIPSSVPLFMAQIYRQHQTLTQAQCDDLLQSATPADLPTEVQWSMTAEEYQQGVRDILYHIQQGDTYQVNFTMKCLFDFHDTPLNLYARLRQRQTVSYGAFIEFPGYAIVSLSPELFFKKQGNVITVKPMKGTAKRSTSPITDAEQRSFLASDEKNRAENVMIVDMLRNDLSRIAEKGSVVVPTLFEIEAYETVWQMTSTVQATINPTPSLYELLRNLFPCGSITGAPKIRTQEIIRDLEQTARGFYTGSIGYILPNRDMTMNVAIRTVVIDQHQQAQMGVGSGIVAQSIPADEYAETLLKSQFLTGVGG